MISFHVTAKYIPPAYRQIKDTNRVIGFIVNGKTHRITIDEALHIANQLNAAVAEGERSERNL